MDIGMLKLSVLPFTRMILSCSESQKSLTLKSSSFVNISAQGCNSFKAPKCCNGEKYKEINLYLC